ncbi:YegP family protein [Aliivibrio wodanis]|uniref:YegP family protein n=1 Tax=Aliivibrio wodanis TaxID=80852 RepID=UPI00406CF7DB
MGHYEIKKSSKITDQPFWFVLKASNGQVIATSEMYTSKQAAENGIKSVQENGSTTEIKDLT